MEKIKLKKIKLKKVFFFDWKPYKESKFVTNRLQEFQSALRQRVPMPPSRHVNQHVQHHKHTQHNHQVLLHPAPHQKTHRDPWPLSYTQFPVSDRSLSMSRASSQHHRNHDHLSARTESHSQRDRSPSLQIMTVWETRNCSANRNTISVPARLFNQALTVCHKEPKWISTTPSVQILAICDREKREKKTGGRQTKRTGVECR